MLAKRAAASGKTVKFSAINLGNLGCFLGVYPALPSLPRLERKVYKFLHTLYHPIAYWPFCVCETANGSSYEASKFANSDMSPQEDRGRRRCDRQPSEELLPGKKMSETLVTREESSFLR
jgi:hypothetical protein